jgi:hypothetical protein
MSDVMAQRIESVQRRIADACARAGREADGVQLVAVSKTHPPEAVGEAAACGVGVFGENKVQEAMAKIPLCPGNLFWHLVGHLQRNKVGPAVELFDLIHSVDSLRLLETIERACEELGKTQKVLLEINVSGEASKFGLKPEEAPAVLEAANRLSRIEVRGLMTMPPWTADVEQARPHFRRLRELRDGWEQSLGLRLPELSMGMSHDFEVAIGEGATIIRVGTAIFGERQRTVTSP